MNKIEDKFIAFVDILGFSDFVEEIERSGLGDLSGALELIKKLGNTTDHDRFAKYGPITCPSAPYMAKDLNFRLTQISDCVVISVEVSPAGLINLLHHCFGIAISLLMEGHQCRGFITRGNILHTDHQFIGTGYMRAYNNEQKVSIFQVDSKDQGTPFIEIDKEVCDYVDQQEDKCVKTMFKRMTEREGTSVAISPFPALKKIPSSIIGAGFDAKKFGESIQVSRDHILRLLKTFERAEGGADEKTSKKIEHYKRKLLEIFENHDRNYETFNKMTRSGVFGKRQ